MTLPEFLQTADGDHAIALDQARTYTVTVPVFITSNTLTVYVVQVGLYDVFTDVSNDIGNPVRGICLALMDRLRGQSEFNLSYELPLGQANIAMLNTLSQALPSHSAAIDNLKTTLLSVSNKVTHPFSNTTLHDVLVVRDAVETFKPLTTDDGYLIIEVTEECETHNPRVSGFNPRLDKWVHLTNFRGVGAVGKYVTEIPRYAFGWEQIRVDNAYGVI